MRDGAAAEADGLSALRVVEAGKADLEQARVLLEKARPELEPRQWALLNGKLLAAERARERYESLRPKGAPAGRESESPALGLVGVGSAVEGASLAPLLVLLAAAWASSTAGPELDPPRWQGAHQDYDARLRELSEAAEKVRLEVEATRRRRGVDVVRLPPPTVELYTVGYRPHPTEPPWRPCNFKGTGGPGPSSPRPADAWLICRYQCGKYHVELPIPGRRAEACEDPRNVKNAEELARSRHQ